MYVRHALVNDQSACTLSRVVYTMWSTMGWRWCGSSAAPVADGERLLGLEPMVSVLDGPLPSLPPALLEAGSSDSEGGL